MFLSFESLVAELQRRVDVIAYNPTRQIITDIRMLPARLNAGECLRQDVAYICEYRQLKLYDPHVNLAPLICVVEPLAAANPALFSNRSVAVVSGSTVAQVMLILLNAIYAYGNKSSPLLEVSQRLLCCQGLDQLLDEGFRILGNPLAVTDPGQAIIAATAPELVSAPDYRRIIVQDHLPVGHVTQVGQRPYFGVTDGLFEDAGDGRLPAVLCKPLTFSQRVMGYLHVFSFNRELAEEDLYAAELLANLMAIELARTAPKYRRLDEGQKAVQFLRDVLDAVSGDLEQTIQRQRELQVAFKPCLYTVVVHARAEDPAQRINFYDLSQSISAMFPGCFSFLYKNSVFVLLNQDREIDDLPSYLAPLLALPGGKNLLVGVSNVFSSVLSVREHGYQSRKAIQLGLVLSPDERLFLYKDYTLYYMMGLCLRSDRVEELCAPELLKLVDYCRSNGGELMETLRAYLKCDRSKLNTSKQLFVHLNTVKYRVAQIQEIMGADLGRDETAMRMSLSLIMLDYQEKFPVFPTMDYEPSPLLPPERI